MHATKPSAAPPLGDALEQAMMPDLAAVMQAGYERSAFASTACLAPYRTLHWHIDLGWKPDSLSTTVDRLQHAKAAGEHESPQNTSLQLSLDPHSFLQGLGLDHDHSDSQSFRDRFEVRLQKWLTSLKGLPYRLNGPSLESMLLIAQSEPEAALDSLRSLKTQGLKQLGLPDLLQPCSDAALSPCSWQKGAYKQRKGQGDSALDLLNACIEGGFQAIIPGSLWPANRFIDFLEQAKVWQSLMYQAHSLGMPWRVALSGEDWIIEGERFALPRQLCFLRLALPATTCIMLPVSVQAELLDLACFSGVSQLFERQQLGKAFDHRSWRALQERMQRVVRWREGLSLGSDGNEHVYPMKTPTLRSTRSKRSNRSKKTRANKATFAGQTFREGSHSQTRPSLVSTIDISTYLPSCSRTSKDGKPSEHSSLAGLLKLITSTPNKASVLCGLQALWELAQSEKCPLSELASRLRQAGVVRVDPSPAESSTGLTIQEQLCLHKELAAGGLDTVGTIELAGCLSSHSQGPSSVFQERIEKIKELFEHSRLVAIRVDMPKGLPCGVWDYLKGLDYLSEHLPKYLSKRVPIRQLPFHTESFKQACMAFGASSFEES